MQEALDERGPQTGGDLSRRDVLRSGVAAAMTLGGAGFAPGAGGAVPGSPAAWSLVQLSDALRRRKIGASELLALYLERIEQINPKLNAVVSMDIEGASMAARRAEQAISDGRPLGPLHGIPLTIKDSFETAGLRTVCGIPALKDYIPKTDAHVVRKLKEAGAILFGKTNMPTANADYQSRNPVFGVTNNPWALDRSPGGSAGGEAAAVAAALTGVGYASEIGGSIRLPAHYTGVYGHKGSFDLIPQTGHIPPGPGLGQYTSLDMAVSGPLARAPEDLEIVVRATVGPREIDRRAWSVNLPPPRARRLSEFRVALWVEDPFCPLGSEVGEAVSNFIDELAKAGARIERRPKIPYDLKYGYEIYESLVFAAFSVGAPQEAFDRNAALADAFRRDTTIYGERFLRAQTMRHRDWQLVNARRREYEARWAEFFRDHDVVLMPVAPSPAIPHHKDEDRALRMMTVDGVTRSYYQQAYWNGLMNVNGCPATVFPIAAGSRSGLPIGMQAMGPYLEDLTTIEFAKQVSRLTPGYRLPGLAAV